VGGRTRYGSRVLFLAPWNGFTLAGTRHRPFQGDPDGLAVTEEEVRDFLGEVCRALPGVQLRREDVSFFHKGFLPMDGTDAASGEVRLAKHYRIHDHAKENGVDGLVTVIGVKYTTARDVAEKTVDVLFRKLGRPAVPSVSRRMRLDGGDLQRFTGFRENVATSGAFGLTPEVLNHLAVLYGTAYPEVLKYIEKDPAFGRTVPGSTLVLAAEIVHAVREEAAVRLSDAVRRRTNLGSGRNPGAESLRFCAGLMAGELGWDPERIDAEIRDTEAAYRTAPGGKSWA
jgi:glycerol-3-phosphate dehydrogenase